MRTSGLVAAQNPGQRAVDGLAVVARRVRQRAWPLGVAALAVVSCLLWLPALDLPLHVDVAGYATVAYWWARDHTLYRTIMISRPQGIFLIFRLIEAAGLGSVRGIHLAGMLCAALCTLTLLAVAGRVWGRGVGFASAALFACIMATPYLEGFTVNAELFMLLPLLGSLYLLLRADDAPLISGRALCSLAGSGALAAIALLVKPAAATLLPLVALWLVRRWHKERPSALAWLGAAAVAGLAFLLTLVPALAHGLMTAPDLYLNAVLLNRLGRDSVVANALPLQLRAFAQNSAFIVVHLPILALAPIGFRAAGQDGDTRRRDLLWLWTLTSLGGVALGGNWSAHYYQQLLPPLAVAVALGLRALLHRPTGLAHAALQGLAMAGVAALLAVQVVALSPPADPAKLVVGYAPADGASPAIAAYLQTHTTPDETIYVAYQQPDIYYLAERRPAARRLDYHELTWTPGAFADQVARLADPATAPRYIVEAQDFDAYGFDADGALRAVVARDYTLETTIGGIPIYRRLDRPASGAATGRPE